MKYRGKESKFTGEELSHLDVSNRYKQVAIVYEHKLDTVSMHALRLERDRVINPAHS